MDFTRLFDILDYQRQRFARADAVSGLRADGQWHTWSTDEVCAERDRLSAGLLAAGLHRGDRVGVLVHRGSPRWAVADAAMLQVGIVPVPIHATARLDEVAHIVRDADLRACFVSSAALRDKLRQATTHVPLVIGLDDLPDTTRWDTLATDPTPTQLDKIRYLRDSIGEQDLAVLLYTSGTTGTPKGVMLTHANIVSNIKSVLAIVPVDRTVTTVSYLPLSHILERTVCYLYQAAGASIWFADSIETLPDTLRAVRPHFFTAVPRVLERTYERLLERRDAAGFLQKKILDWAIALGERFPYAGGQAMPLDYRIKRMVADFLVYRHWRKAMGGRVRHIAVGAAALQPRLGRLFSAAGVDVREGYGLTETSPVIAFNRFEPGGVRFGTVGIPAPGVEVRIAEPDDEAVEGEIEVRGPNVMAGYLGLPDETAARFTPDGWLRTGDLGRFEHKRFLRITGRKSEVFKTTSGKFVAPAYVEEQLKTSPFVDQCLALGLNQPYVAALIVPNFKHLEAWCRDNNVHWTAPQFMVLNPKVEKLFRSELEQINENLLGKEEKVREFALLDTPWTAENGLLTPTLKVRRATVERQFAAEVQQLFGG
jgi:long-chain acyl-CoA synthetase